MEHCRPEEEADDDTDDNFDHDNLLDCLALLFQSFPS